MAKKGGALMTKRLNRTDYRYLLELIEKDIRDTKGYLYPPEDVDWGLTSRERAEFREALKKAQSIHRKICRRAWPGDMTYCDQPSIRGLVDQERPWSPENEKAPS